MLIISVIIVFSLLLYRSFAQRILKEINQQHWLDMKHQKEMLLQHIRVQESERERIAQQLHDDIGNRLHVLAVWFQTPNYWQNPRSKEITEKQIPELIETTRNVSHALYPATLKRFGLISAIEELSLTLSAQLKLQLITTQHERLLNTEQQLQTYRIVQEFLSNVLKHSKATRMTIHLRSNQKRCLLILSDNGVGFDSRQQASGMGLKNIALRISTMGALSKWKSNKNGSRLIILIPNHEQAH